MVGVGGTHVNHQRAALGHLKVGIVGHVVYAFAANKVVNVFPFFCLVVPGLELGHLLMLGHAAGASIAKVGLLEDVLHEITLKSDLLQGACRRDLCGIESFVEFLSNVVFDLAGQFIVGVVCRGCGTGVATLVVESPLVTGLDGTVLLDKGVVVLSDGRVLLVLLNQILVIKVVT